MPRTSIREDRNTSKIEAKNKLMHTTNQNCVLPSPGEEEQKLALVVGQPVEKCVLLHAHE